ncbi:LptA/OstA family protein [Nodularia spumigena]|uniref:LptA/OstA family protein n=1 Tax=Nodularia spumigena UHCC 0060 TaxID=3110300 RepID=A0ABU5UT46_NODSP|nr:LptA/OstA family protein [Nodularia spumigena]MEA5526292.1 LptA/OstA family protein [Nodularia spumigena UHCC 0143]MEA5609434.1 LptA/OstA family protein [Nodularia spumigena UHCC 0060]MEA5615758.1 LptA/OstA family protein [Nodularia spumigena UHCC 0040]
MMSCYQLPVSQIRRLGLALMLPAALLGSFTFPTHVQTATAQTSQQNSPLTISADVQEYNANTQVATARGNVQMLYPARQIKATAAQAQFFSKERRIDLSGNVYILQQGINSIRAEKVTYLIDEGRFVALPQSNRQVESTYMVNDTEVDGQSN